MALDVVAEIKSKIDPVDFIGRFTRLQKSGRNFKALCPFHSEKTPSFYVFPDKGTWRCFGSCGEGGDLFSFVQKRENLDFRDALRQLAAEAGVELSAESSQRRTRTDKLAAVVSAAVDFYQRCLREPGGEEARAYLYEKRGLKPEAVEAFRLGWAPNEWRVLRDYLASRGYGESDMIGAGLLVEPDSGGAPYDRFRGRVIIPITDERGIFVGMGGRGLQGEEPKYLNSPQTDLFDKGRTLFGLDLAAKPIREAGVAVVVEGYMDVIGPWQAGFQNVVATMGTSLTEHHVALLKRHAKRVVLAMDPDAAGLAATERAGGLFLGFDSPESAARSARTAQAITRGSDLDLRVAPLPAGYDPDEIARDDPDGWKQAIDGATPFVSFLLERAAAAPNESALDARRLVQRLKPILLTVSDPIERATYVQRMARHLGLDERDVFQAVRLGIAPPPRRSGDFVPRDELTQEDYFLVLLFKHPGLRAEVRAFPATLISDAVAREVFRRWLSNDPPGPGDLDPLVERYQRLSSYRFPQLDPLTARRALQRLTDAIVRERRIANLEANTQDMHRQEREIGANEVAEIVLSAWMGEDPGEDDREIVETVIEAQQLGLSIHRREEFDGADVATR
ncbi:MAG: DNA primase [Dehalococcoidia bacterium]